jgi:hypothetical protein
MLKVAAILCPASLLTRCRHFFLLIVIGFIELHAQFVDHSMTGWWRKRASSTKRFGV